MRLRRGSLKAVWYAAAAFLLLVGGHRLLFRRASPLGARVLPRSRWRPAVKPDTNRLRPLGKPVKITVHHSAGESGAEDGGAPVDTAAVIRSIQRYHVTGRGWADIGYHFVIDHEGRIWEARPLAYQGAHAGNAELNRQNIGVVVLGNFELRPPNPAEEGALVWLLGTLCKEYRIPPGNIFGHADLKPTLCPGKHLRAVVERLRTRGFGG
jgi:hypothetical protein